MGGPRPEAAGGDTLVTTMPNPDGLAPTGADRALRAAAWMLAALGSFVLMAVAVRQLGGRVGTAEILCFRSVVALAILLLLWPRVGRDAYATRRPALHVIRNVIHFGGQYAWVWGIAALPLATVTAIEFTTPLWVTLLAALALRERLTLARGLAVAAGLAGILLIVRPGPGGAATGAMIVLAGALCFATSILIVKALVRTDRVTAIVFHMSLIQLPLGLAGALPAWVWPRPSELPWLLAVGALSLTAHYTMGRALTLGDASFVLPLEFLRLPMMALVGLALYGEPLDAWTLAGAALIVAGNYWSLRQEARAVRTT